jgi:hypothetical protein
VTSGLGDPRVPRILAMRVRAAWRTIAAEWHDAPVATGGTLLVIVGCTGLGFARLASLIARDERYALGASAGMVGIVLALHGLRRDVVMLRRAGVSTPVLYAAEYLVVALPLVVLLLATARWHGALPTMLGAMLVARLPAGRLARAHGSAAMRRLPVPSPFAFEWIAAVRRGWPLLSIAAVLTVLGLVVRDARWPSLWAIALAALVGADGYLTPTAEGWPMVHAFRQSPHPFLARKISLAVASFAAVAVVPAVALVLARPMVERALFAVAAIGLGSALIALAVLVKYCLYEPGRRPAPLVAVVMMATGVAAAALVLPLAPVVFALLWRRAARAVSPYLTRAEPAHALIGVEVAA